MGVDRHGLLEVEHRLVRAAGGVLSAHLPRHPVVVSMACAASMLLIVPSARGRYRALVR
jgi:hypothetical protein